MTYFRENCCTTCAWMREQTGVTNRPFDEMATLKSPRDLVEGDVVISLKRDEKLDRHALGHVLHVYSVLPPQRRKVAVVQWEDEPEPRHVLSEGATAMLVMRRAS